VQRGIRWAGGADYAGTPFAARYSLWASVARKTLNATDGAQPFGTSEAVDIQTALPAEALLAAHQMFLDDRIGSVRTGKGAGRGGGEPELVQDPDESVKGLKRRPAVVARRDRVPRRRPRARRAELTGECRAPCRHFQGCRYRRSLKKS